MDLRLTARSLPSFSQAWASSTPLHHQGIPVQMVSLSSTYRWIKICFQRVLILGPFRKSPAEILHRRNLTTKVQAEIDINAIRSLLQERQLKMSLAHDSSRRAKKARPLVVGERCYVLGPNNKWIDAFVTYTKDSGRSYDTQVEATEGTSRGTAHTSDQEGLTSLRFMTLSYSGTPDRKAAEKQNSITSGQLANLNSQKTVLSGKPTRNIKPTNTSQVLVSETVPSRRV